MHTGLTFTLTVVIAFLQTDSSFLRRHPLSDTLDHYLAITNPLSPGILRGYLIIINEIFHSHGRLVFSYYNSGI